MRILILFDADLDADADLDLSFNPDAGLDLDPDPGFQKRLKLLKKCSNRLVFQTFWPVLCKWIGIQIRFQIQLVTLMRIQMRIRILIFI